MNAHRLAEERSLALHQEVADRMRKNPEIVERARERVNGWLRDGSVHHEYAERWSKLLTRPVEEIAKAIVRRGQEAHDLRQVSPFAGVVDPRTRWRIRRDVRSRVGK